MSTHGTDQYLVQRYLCTDRARSAVVALLTSGAIVLAQFIGFLFIGVLLFAFYHPYTDAGYMTATSAALFLSLVAIECSQISSPIICRPDFLGWWSRRSLPRRCPRR